MQSLATTTVIVDGKEVVIPAAVAPPVKEIVERVVEVEKVKASQCSAPRLLWPAGPLHRLASFISVLFIAT